MHHQNGAHLRCGGGGRGEVRKQVGRIGCNMDDLVVCLCSVPCGRQPRQTQPVAQRRIGCHPAGTDCVGDDRQGIPASQTGAGERFRRRQQILEAGDAKHASASQRRLERSFGPAARVGEQGAGADRHHRTQEGRGAGSGEEGPAVLQVPDVEQDRAGAGIARQPVKHQAETDIGIAADADDVAEPDTVWLGPVQDGAAQGGGLRHQPQPSGRRWQMRARGVQPDSRYDDAERTWPQHAHAAPAHRIRKAFGHADHHRCKCALRCQRRQGHGHRAGWRREHRQVRSFREGREVRAVIGIQLEDLALEPARLQICQHLPALGRAATDHRDGTGMEQPSGAEAARGPEGQKGHGGHSISPCAGPRSTGRPSLFAVVHAMAWHGC
jgi:hypothetical protein